MSASFGAAIFITRTASLHAETWKELLDAFLAGRDGPLNMLAISMALRPCGPSPPHLHPIFDRVQVDRQSEWRHSCVAFSSAQGW